MPVMPDFRPVTPIAGDVMRAYADLVPPEVTELWEQHGTGTFANGLLQVVEAVAKSFKAFLAGLSSERFVMERLDGRSFFEAVDANGPLARDESFGCVPVLGLGGSERVENLQNVKTVEHIAIITQLMGPLVY